MDRNWVKNETSQNSIFPSSIDAPSLGRSFQLVFSPILVRGVLECGALAFDNGFKNSFGTMLKIGSCKTKTTRRKTEHINKLGVELVKPR